MQSEDKESLFQVGGVSRVAAQKEERVERSRNKNKSRPTGAQAGGKAGEGQPEKQWGPIRRL